jgi:hypothetical protein
MLSAFLRLSKTVATASFNEDVQYEVPLLHLKSQTKGGSQQTTRQNIDNLINNTYFYTNNTD